MQIEKLCNSPQDIEFAIKDGAIYILQARPITTLPKKTEKNVLVFQKSITRDWSSIYAQVWHKVFTKEFKKQFGWGLTETVYRVDDNCVSVYRAPLEYIEGMKSFVLKELKRNSRWLAQQAKEVLKQTESIIKWIRFVKRKPYSSYNNDELASILENLIRKNVEVGPKYIVMLWFPIQMEKSKESKIYKDAALIATKTRSEIHNLGSIVDKFIRELVEEVLKRAKIPHNLSKFATCQEILDYLRNGTLIAKIGLMKKKEKGFIITKDGILYESVQNYLNKKGHSMADDGNVPRGVLIAGTTAYGGFAKGKVKIIMNKGEFRKFKNKDILVTAMTTPDFLPLMQRASAFVTDEGGITCHAAINARELKKPCVIGTKIATKFLKDGDLVEVNATKGTIKK